jgi:hypothetical protein
LIGPFVETPRCPEADISTIRTVTTTSLDFIRGSDRPIHTYVDACGRADSRGGSPGHRPHRRSDLEGGDDVTRRLRSWVPSLALALTAAACGGGEPAEVGSGGPGTDTQATLAIESPSEGAEVERSFMLEFESSEALGPTESGDFHVHVFYDGNEDEYEVVTANAFEAKGLSAGKHVIGASLRNADHSDAGAEDEVTVTVVARSKRAKSSDGDDGQDGSVYDY